MGEIIAITNQKGGVGKTTTAINLAASLAVLERKTLLIDADPQGNTTNSLVLTPFDFSFETIDLFNFSDEIKFDFITTSTPNLCLLPTTIKLVNLELKGKNLYGTNYQLGKSLEHLKNLFDYIIIDCGPSLNFITTSILCQCDSVIIPIQCEFYAYTGLKKLFKVIRNIQKNYNSSLEIKGLLITLYDKRLVFSNFIVSEIYNNFNKLVFKTIIHRTVKVGEAQNHGKTILEFDATCVGAKNYLSLAAELLENDSKMKKFKLDKDLTQILDENEKSSQAISSIFEKLPINKSDKLYSKYTKNLNKLIGLNKQDVLSIFGDSLNDKFSNIWMFRLNDNSFLKKRFLYLYFENKKVVNFETTYFKKKDVE